MQLTVPGGESTLDGDGDDMGGVEIGGFLVDAGDVFFTPTGVGVGLFVLLLLLLLLETGVDEDGRKNDSLTPVAFELDGTNPAESGDTRAVCCNGVVRL